MIPYFSLPLFRNYRSFSHTRQFTASATATATATATASASASHHRRLAPAADTVRVLEEEEIIE